MKLLLIQPKTTGTIMGQVSDSGKAGFIRLSLPVVAALTPPDVEVEIVDSRIQDIDYDEPVDLVGISVLTAEAPSAYEIAAEFRRRDVKVVLGGYHPTLVPEEAMQNCDAIVVGEAEPVWGGLLEDFKNGRLQRRYPPEGVARCTSGEQIAKPRRDLLDPSRYTGFNVVQATRGCVHDCAFCSVRAFHKAYVTRPIASVVEEIKEIIEDTKERDLLVRLRLMKPHITFVDDNLTARKDYALELLEAIVPLGITWDAQTESGLGLDADLLDAAARSGCTCVSVGFETAAPDSRVLLRKHKQEDTSDRSLAELFKEEVERFHSRGISVVGNFIFGLVFTGQESEDTVEVFDQVLALTEDIDLDAAVFHVLTPYPGTRMRDRLEDEGRVMTNDWAHYNCGEAVFVPDKMTPEELLRGFYRTYAQFHSFWRTIRRVLKPRRGMILRLAWHFSMRRKLKRVRARHISAGEPWTADLRSHWDEYWQRVGR